MAEYNLISKYEFNMGSGITEIGFTDDDQLFTKIMFAKKVAPLTTISSVTIKKGALTQKLQYDIKIIKENGKEQLFQILQIDSFDPQGVKFVNELKSKIPASCLWIDKFEAKTLDVKNSMSSRTYDLQIMWFIKGKLMAGYGRGIQIFMNYGLFTLICLGLPLPLLVYVIAAGCHRVKTDDNGIKIKKLFSKYFAWQDVDHIDVHTYKIIVTQYGALADSNILLVFKLHSKNGSKRKFTIRSLEGKQFVKEMIERKKISEETASRFI